jgi:eukaryotic-like serine/threonine-protein kinase
VGYDLVKTGEIVEGRYKILRPLADGGMGTVFLAEHWLIKRKVALKILHKELVDDPTMIRRFMNEALAAGTLGHPNIVESTDMGFTQQDVPYIVFEYLEGNLLSEEILRLHEMPVTRVLSIAHQIASALEAAHDAGIVHRDLKTDNIFLIQKPGSPDHVKVLDFGISRFLRASDRTAMGGNLLGTPEFMAPEQVLSPDQIDHRVDIYALGVVMYEMLTGAVPFGFKAERRGEMPTVEEAHALLGRIINELPAPVARMDLPIGLGEMIEDKLLAKNPARRHQSMREVQTALESFGRGLPQPITLVNPRNAATPPHGIPKLAEPVERPSRATLPGTDLAREVQMLGKRWKLVDTDLVADLFSRHMRRLAMAVEAAATIADEIEHHPQIVLDYPKLRLTIPNVHTVIDLVLAARIENWLRDNGW